MRDGVHVEGLGSRGGVHVEGLGSRGGVHMECMALALQQYYGEILTCKIRHYHMS